MHKDLLVLNWDQELMLTTQGGPVELTGWGEKGELIVILSCFFVLVTLFLIHEL